MKQHELEQGILAGICATWENREYVLSKIKPEDFQDPKSRVVLKAIETLNMDMPRFDTSDIDNYIDHAEGSSMPYMEWIVGRNAVLMDVSDKADYYIEQLKERAFRRNVVRKATLAIQQAQSDSTDLSELIETVGQLENESTTSLEMPGLTPSEIQERDANMPEADRLTIGVPYFDHVMYTNGGSHKGTTEVIFGETKHGKSQYAMWRTAQYLKQGYNGVFIIVENTDRSIAKDLTVYMRDHKNMLDKIRIADRRQGISDLNSVVNTVRYWKAKADIDFFVVDYIQRIPVKGTGPKDSHARITAASNRLTDLAQETDTFGMLLAQPHRMEKHRKGWQRQVRVSDLDGASAIEKDAFCGTSVFRPLREKSLWINGMDGELAVTGPDQMEAPKNSVYIQQQIIRAGELCTGYYRFEHTNLGLVAKDDIQENTGIEDILE